jgi:hypothetical protein
MMARIEEEARPWQLLWDHSITVSCCYDTYWVALPEIRYRIRRQILAVITIKS